MSVLRGEMVLCNMFVAIDSINFKCYILLPIFRREDL